MKDNVKRYVIEKIDERLKTLDHFIEVLDSCIKEDSDSIKNLEKSIENYQKLLEKHNNEKSAYVREALDFMEAKDELDEGEEK